MAKKETGTTTEDQEVEEFEEHPPLPSPTNIYEVFETDSGLETNGTWFDYLFGKFKLSYVGSNQSFQQEYADRMKPYAQAELTGQLDPKIRIKIQIECYSRHIIKEWKEVYDRDGQEIKFSYENCVNLLTDLPRLFEQLRDVATRFSNYRRIYADEVAKN